MKTINNSRLAVTNRQFFNNFSLPIWMAVAMSISLGFVTNPVRAEDIQHYRHIAPQGVENTTGKTSQNTQQTSLAKDTKDESAISGDANSPNEPVSKPEDGKLEQHEYQNLEMETKKEGEIR